MNNDSDRSSFFIHSAPESFIHITPESLFTSARNDYSHAPEYARSVILVIDELQRVAGENLQGILQDARSFGIHAILANQSLTDLKSPTGFDLAPAIMTNTRVKFFFTSPSERECYVYVERGKGFTEARQFPQKGNPWLRDLAPEEFAYHVRLAWPFLWSEYQRRESLPLPTWDEVPGGDFYRDENLPEVDEAEVQPTDALPRNFKLLRDTEWEQQVSLIHALFAEENDTAEETSAEANLTPEDVRQMQEGIYQSIAERGPDRVRCVLDLLFLNFLNGVETPVTWKQLWEKCWKEPLETLRGGDVEPAAKVRQTVYRAREIMDRYFESEAGGRWAYRVVIEPNEYRLQTRPNRLEIDLGDDSPFLDSAFPEPESLDADDD